MANEYTLADFERLAPSTLEKAVIRTWIEASPLMDSLMFEEKKALSVEFLRWNSLPSVPWRNIGDSFVQRKVEPEPIKERPYFIGAKCDIPKEYVIADPTQRANQEKAISTSIAYGFNESFINGLPTDQKELIGLWYRLVNDMASSQSVDGGSLDMSPDGAGTTKAFFRLVEDLLSRLDGVSNATDIDLLMNRQMKLAFEAAMRESGLLDTTQDNIGRKFSTYGGARLVDIGYAYDQSTQIITNVELADGSALTGHDCTTIYAIKRGGDYLKGFYEFPITVVDKGLLEDGVNYRTIIDWAPGFRLINPRSMARLYGVMAA